MTKLRPIQALHLANTLKKSTEWKIQVYEKSILSGTDDSFTSFCRTMKETEDIELRMISGLIEFIKSESKTSCKHPKKIQDTDPNGAVYCMKCGEDI
ncbi:MAG: hypothetical protein IIA82_08130 [Thaumarchaeota archaeon]|nr:hypothetical protein [Nitrososphaerota archaeon]